MYQRSFIKWAGNKYTILNQLFETLPPAGKLIEPFLGSGSVFLNSDYQRYLLNDVNPDLINVFSYLKQDHTQFISQLKTLFDERYNTPDTYYSFRAAFNTTDDQYEKALLFIYLNRHGYQGLCRYNLSGVFNVPYGHYKRVYFPEDEIVNISKKLKRANLMNDHFSQAFRRARKGDIIYCDPPYMALNKTANFTSYSTGGFSYENQARLAELAESARNRGIHVVISNHDTPITRSLYGAACHVKSIPVRRSINAKSSKNKSVNELIASYTPIEIALNT
ncbi:Dam family site-specific DNA-(adenine-N6)-methyltransferase [Pseudoalteromonas nigrifaciens]|uniref:Dam family site-specific DNA-(adenine-N6)-methyltransferase n=1 Tax=Pseudoalteromonas nigrifaciens TaxID=28109 RepID=UPI003FD29216